ncbi:MAG: hypothetical protein U0798_09955 [Gemmataceae bacterium]
MSTRRTKRIERTPRTLKKVSGENVNRSKEEMEVRGNQKGSLQGGGVAGEKTHEEIAFVDDHHRDVMFE